MIVRFDLLTIITSISCFITVNAKVKLRHGTNGMSFEDSTTCAEFSKFARFNPYSVLYRKWFVFFYWGPPRSHETFIFTFPTANHTKHLHKIFDGKTIIPIDWSARHILMEDNKDHMHLLVERGDRGEYWMYLLQKAVNGIKIRPQDTRIKQTGDNNILGIMNCDRGTVLAMSDINNVPPKNRLQEEAARLGFRGRRGKSYLYQGHEWMPIPEDDEKQYWARPKPSVSFQKASNEAESSEQSSKEAILQTTTVPATSQIVSKMEESHTSKKKINLKSTKDDSTSEPGNSQSTKEQDRQGTAMKESIEATDESVNSSPNKESVNKLTNDAETTQIFNELGSQQSTNEPNKIEPTTEKENKEPQSSKEPYIQECNDCNELVYTKSTDDHYLP